MHPFLEMKNNFGQGKTNLDLFLEEKERLETILNAPATTPKERDNRYGSEWSLYAMNEIINGQETNEFMLQKYLTEIVTAKIMRSVEQKNETRHVTYVNAAPEKVRTPLLN